MTDGSPETRRDRDEEDRFRQLLDTAPDAIVVVGADERISLVNLQTERMFGYSRSELLGQELAILIPQRFRHAHQGHVASFIKAPVIRAMGSGLTLTGRRKDGAELPIEVSLSPVRTGGSISVSAAIRDITQRVKVEAAAKLAAERLASAVESVHDGFALFDVNDNLALCNSVYRRLLGEGSIKGPLIGRSYEAILDAWLPDLAFPSDAERARFREHRLASRREREATFDVRTRDGRSLRVIDRRTAEGGVVKTIWDLTEDVRLAEELRVARSIAEAASAAKSEFLASMSHELRTPLNAILGFAQLLHGDRKEPLSHRHRDRVARIVAGGEHLLRLIDDILDLSHIEAGRVSISNEPVRVAEVVEETRATLDSSAARADLRLEVTPAPAALPLVVADRTRLAQILMNFGSNAIKYNRPGGKVVFAISVPTPDCVRITVSDTGAGIPLDKQDKLFQPFQRAGQETGPIEGTGIGLVITKRLAELMGGQVGFRSTSGVGSDFWVDIRAHDAGHSMKPPAPTAEPALPISFGGTARHRVLYVEDNPANVEFIRALVSDFEGVDIVTAPTAEMGVELARARKPDVILMDINLPGMSGTEALVELQNDPGTRDIPVIALTASASDRDQRKGLQAGFHRYLTKPVKVDELVAALQSVFGEIQ